MSTKTNGIATIKEARTKLYYSVSPSCNLQLNKAITKSEVTSLGATVSTAYTNNQCVKYSDITRPSVTWNIHDELTVPSVTTATTPAYSDRRDATFSKWDTDPLEGCGRLDTCYYNKLTEDDHLSYFESIDLPNISETFSESIASVATPHYTADLLWISNCTLIHPKDSAAKHPNLLSLSDSSDNALLNYFNNNHYAIDVLLELNQDTSCGYCLLNAQNNFVNFTLSNLYALMKEGQKFTLVYSSVTNPEHMELHVSYYIKLDTTWVKSDNIIGDAGVVISKDKFLIKGNLLLDDVQIFNITDDDTGNAIYDLRVYTTYDSTTLLYYLFFTFIKTSPKPGVGAYYLYEWCIDGFENSAGELDDINFEYTRYDSTLNPPSQTPFWDSLYIPKGICDSSALYSLGILEYEETDIIWPSKEGSSKMFWLAPFSINNNPVYASTDFCIPNTINHTRILKSNGKNLSALELAYVRSPLTFAHQTADPTSVILSTTNSSYVLDSIVLTSGHASDGKSIVKASDDCYIIFSCPSTDYMQWTLLDIFDGYLERTDWLDTILILNNNHYFGVPESLFFDEKIQSHLKSQMSITDNPRGIQVRLPVFGQILDAMYTRIGNVPSVYPFFIYYKTYYYSYIIENFNS